MAFSPFSRFRNFTLDNLKALLEVYPDEARTMEWSEAANEIEAVSPGYKRTSYQQACQLGLEDRGGNPFRIQSYLFTFDDSNLTRYLEFWLKTYFAPNPYVRSDDPPILIYCEMVKAILDAPGHEISYTDFFRARMGGGSEDILLNAVKNYGKPVRVKKEGGEYLLYLEENDIPKAQKEVSYIEENLPIGDSESRKEFFDRYCYANFCGFFGRDAARKTGAENILLYGVPGSGKSHTIKTKYCPMEQYMERVVFHPDYTCSDFVGQILPKVENTENGDKLKYEFTPGPFTRILRKAEEDPSNYYYLVIEELSRGNAPAIFGEVFQLLDRKDEEEYPANKVGESEFGISNYEVALEVYKNAEHQVRIPSNLYILATMNTADQNVFTLDTAFQRRWNMKQIENNFEKSRHSMDMIEGTRIAWGAFATVVNDLIIDTNEDMLSSEDKRLGTYFAKKKELAADRFPEKVLKYLWDDAFKMDRDTVFKTELKTLEEVVVMYEESEQDKLSSVLNREVYKKMLDKMSAEEETDEREERTAQE